MKKGLIDIIGMPLISVAIAITVLISLLSVIDRVGDREFFEKQRLAIDISLMIDTIYGARGNVLLYYSQDEEFIFDIQHNKVIVSGGKDKARGGFVFLEDSDKELHVTTISTKDEEIKGLIMRKQGEDIYITKALEEGNDNMLFYDCPEIRTSLTTVIIDSQDDARNIASRMKAIGDYETTRDVTQEQELTIQQRLDRIKTKPFLSLEEGEKNTIKAYVNYDGQNKEESIALACNIINNILNNIREIEKTAIIPVNKDSLDETDTRNILINDNTGVLLQIGNNLLTEEVAKGINNGIKTFG